MERVKTEIQEVFDLSYWRTVTATVEGLSFADAFYRRFLATSGEVAALFAGTDFDVQKRMFLLSIVYVASRYTKERPGRILEDLARRHREVGATPEMFRVWIKSLLETVEEYDPEWGDDVHRAWQTVLEPGIAYMVSSCGK